MSPPSVQTPPVGEHHSAPTSAQALAKFALQLQHRLDSLPDNLDKSWHAAIGLAAWGSMPLPPGETRRRVLTHLFQQWCGPLPPLPSLATPAGRLALLARSRLLPRLCGLALLCRPGVLRCCVERRARQSLARALGPAFIPLLDLSSSGAPVSAEAASWTPRRWAWVGYTDLARAGAWPSLSLRRLVRLSLPAAHSAPGHARLRAPPAVMSVQRGLAGLEALFTGEAPW